MCYHAKSNWNWYKPASPPSLRRRAGLPPFQHAPEHFQQGFQVFAAEEQFDGEDEGEGDEGDGGGIEDPGEPVLRFGEGEEKLILPNMLSSSHDYVLP